MTTEQFLKNLTEKQKKVLDFAKLIHGNQTRKYTGEPYYNHLINVAQLIYENGLSLLLVEIAFCHDLLEDTGLTTKELKKELRYIGYNKGQTNFISDCVRELTDVYTIKAYPNLNRLERKKMESNRLGDISDSSQTVKYADLIDNTLSICEHDPKFAKVYLQEKKDILSKMKNGNFDLYLMACATLYNEKCKL